VLYNIAFQDNIYILLRQIDTINNGLKLELDSSLFEEKIFIDLVFFDKTIKKLFGYIYPQSSLHNFIDILQCLHFCITKYLELLNNILPYRDNVKKYINENEINLLNISMEHKKMVKQIEEVIAKNEPLEAEHEMVSHNELLELLNA